MPRLALFVFLLLWGVLFASFFYFSEVPPRNANPAALIVLGSIPPLLFLGLAATERTFRNTLVVGSGALLVLGAAVGLLYFNSPVHLRQPELADYREPSPRSDRVLGPFVSTPYPVVDKMLELAAITKDDLVYDLGCGDGRIVIAAAKKYGARGIGIEIDPRVAQLARDLVKKEGVEHLVEIREADALKVPDLERATVLALYVFPEPLREELLPQFEKRLKPGTRVVTHDYEMGDWVPEKMTFLYSRDDYDGYRKHLVMLWRVPAK